MSGLERRVASRLLGYIAEDFHERELDLVDCEAFDGLTEGQLDCLEVAFNKWKGDKRRGGYVPFVAITPVEWSTFLAERLIAGISV